MKPLFIPLKREHFEAFERGEKTTEYRVVGPRWNAGTCAIGRPVTLRLGYSGRSLWRTIVAFNVIRIEEAPPVVSEIFPKAEHIAAIQVSRT